MSGARRGGLPAQFFCEVQCSTVESVRRVVFSELSGLPTQQQRRVGVTITRALRDAGLLRSSIEECVEAGELGRLWGRSREWVVRTFYASGALPWGVIFRDGGGWLIPASVAENYLTQHVPAKVAAEKEPRRGLSGGGKVFQRAERAGGLVGDRPGAGEFGRLDGATATARRTDAVSVREADFLGNGGG